MARLSEEVIITAAETFVSERGRTPTYEELQELLGVKSPTTLNKYYRPWRTRRDIELQEAKTPAPARVEMLPIPETLNLAVAGAWSQVVAEIKAEAQREIQEAQLHLKSRMEQLVSDLNERDATITAIEEQSETNQEVFEAEILRLREQIEARDTALGSAREQLLKAAEDLSAEKAKTVILTMDLSEAKKELTAEREKTSTEREKVSAALAQVKGLTSEVKSLSVDLEESRGHLASEREKANAATEKAAGLSAELHQVRADLDEERHAVERERQRGDAAVNQLSGLTTDVERLKTDLSEAKGEAVKEREKGGEALARVAGLTASVQRLETDLTAERQRTDKAVTSYAEVSALLEREMAMRKEKGEVKA